MKIGEISKILGINSSTVRFYERHGLIDADSIDRGENGYRVYSQKDLQELQLILKFKDLGLELNEIKSLLCDDSKICGDLLTSIDDQLDKCRQLEAVIKNRIASLILAKDRCESDCKPNSEVRMCCALSV